MSSRRGTGTSSNPLSKGKSVSEASSPNVEQLTHDVADINLDSEQDDGQWAVYTKKSKNKVGSSPSKPWNSQNSNPKAWSHPDVQKLGMRSNAGSGRTSGSPWQTQTADSRMHSSRGNPRPQSSNRSFGNNHVPPQAAIPPPLEHGWNWQSRSSTIPPEETHGQEFDYTEVQHKNEEDVVDNYDEESEGMDDSDDEFLSDGFDSDTSQKSHETRKKSKWFMKFFESLDGLSVDEINEPERQWHCPACQGGPGAIDWYRGLQPLMTHAKTKGSQRVKLHRELAELLEEELRRKGTSVIPAGEVFGKWKGLLDEERDHLIIWPPMVVIMNTKLEQDENDKWIGMGNQELLNYFNSYDAVKARHSYGPQGHRGMSLLVFESSARGYLEAERLHKHFVEEGTDRNAWDSNRRALFYPGGKRQLYGYMAVKDDLEYFNHHSQGKSRLKYEIKSYQEMVVKQIKQMSEDNQQLVWLRNRVAREQRHSKALEESFGIVSEKLRKTREENHIVIQRTKIQHQQNKEEMDYQEQFFKEQIRVIHEARDAKEEDFEKIQQEEREKVKKLNVNASNSEDHKRRGKEIDNFIQGQDKEMENFVAERDKLLKVHEHKMVAMKKSHWEEEVELEKEFDAELSQLMARYTPNH
ncbi:XS domain-containing protein / XS zinc finger domain-containing protein-related isoform 1 [Tripterygium wilfordii]|uniref:XS domain-containing protein / XS zinc finger domain-containing protein-related isoform 1 n=1 Tax=Tripterygium wilfordii TaxID=458696 RepID=A0A7J7DFA2_TRIWF|nr:protein SUPPRESSOR OF GENE SILENCING 3 [Tripterygium wilfordii]KAF5745075.1 XS domain-containing protein / XS zinc finger domain-containing protein-related isoform 1 [Tripterygium wilfordii]